MSKCCSLWVCRSAFRASYKVSSFLTSFPFIWQPFNFPLSLNLKCIMFNLYQISNITGKCKFLGDVLDFRLKLQIICMGHMAWAPKGCKEQSPENSASFKLGAGHNLYVIHTLYSCLACFFLFSQKLHPKQTLAIFFFETLLKQVKCHHRKQCRWKNT